MIEQCKVRQNLANEENEEENNFQCGECGEMFLLKSDVNHHMKSKHDANECSDCLVHKRKTFEVNQKLIEARKLIETLKENNEYLTKKMC